MISNELNQSCSNIFFLILSGLQQGSLNDHNPWPMNGELKLIFTDSLINKSRDLKFKSIFNKSKTNIHLNKHLIKKVEIPVYE